jgi:hypothetical protein
VTQEKNTQVIYILYREYQMGVDVHRDEVIEVDTYI